MLSLNWRAVASFGVPAPILAWLPIAGPRDCDRFMGDSPYDEDEESYNDDDAFDDRDTEIGNVRVSVRIRPPTEDERSGAAPGGANCVEADGKRVAVHTAKRTTEPHMFSFDYVFDPAATQDEVMITMATLALLGALCIGSATAGEAARRCSSSGRWRNRCWGV